MKLPLFHEVKRAKPLLGTYIEITACGIEETKLHQAICLAFERIELVQQLMSVYEEESEVSLINREAFFRPIRVSSQTWLVLKESQCVSVHSKGSFSITACPLHRNHDGLDPHSFDYQNVELSENQMVSLLHPQTQINLGGVAKGFAVDQAVEVLLEQGVEAGLVNAGGDLRAFGDRVFSVQIRHPEISGAFLMSVSLSNESLANSGRYFGGSYINLNQCGPDQATLAAGVRSQTCLRADALTKVLMNEGKKAAWILEDFISSGYLVHSSENSDHAVWTYGQTFL